MKDAEYALIRYVPDLARNEPVNIGVIVWCDDQWRVRIDEAAANRVKRDYPWIEKDTILYLQSLFSERVGRQGALSFIQSHESYNVHITEPRATTLVEERPNEIDITVDRLVSRIVCPHRHRGDGAHENPTRRVSTYLRPWIQSHIVMENHPLRAQTGINRTVSFFANSGTNVALDVVRLAIKDVDDIRLRADAEGMKIYDILQANAVRRCLVFLATSPRPEYESVNEDARRIVTSGGGEVVSSPEEAAEMMRQEIDRHQEQPQLALV